MIVADASAIVQLVLAADETLTTMLVGGDLVCVPHLLDVEVTHALRKSALRGDMSPRRASVALDDFAALPFERYDHGPLLKRAWRLREMITASDAMYVVLAEALNAALVTADVKLAHAAAPLVEITLVKV